MSRTRGYIVLAAAILMQLCLGGIYAWSFFSPILQARFGFAPERTALIFGTHMCVFTVSLLFTGPLQDRYGPRPLAMLSGVLLTAGYLTAGLAGGSFVRWWLGVGVIMGLAVGFGYVCPIATALKWFPRHKGLVAGLAVAGYGGAAIVLSNLARMLTADGWDVSAIFRAVGVVYGAIVVGMGALMFLPGPLPPRTELAFRRRTVLREARFWWLFAAFFCSAFAGTTVISHLRAIGESLGNSARIATLAISTLAVGNASGRIVWGFIYDRLGGRRSILLSLMLMAGSVLAVVGLGRFEAGFLIAAALVGFCYGGNFSIYAPEAARLHGVHLMGAVYPLLLLSHGIAGQVGPPLAGLLTRLQAGYLPGLLAGAAVTLAGLVAFARWAPPAAAGGTEQGSPETPVPSETPITADGTSCP